MKKNFVLPILVSLLFSCNNSYEENRIKAESKDIIESVYASVTVRPETSYEPQSVRSGIIKKIYVEEGDIVEKGQVLFQISPSAEFLNQLTNAKVTLEQAKSDYIGDNNLLANINLEIQTVSDQLTLDSTNFKRQERLWSQDIGKKVDFEKMKLIYQTTKTQLSNLHLKRTQTKVKLQNQYEKSYNNIQSSKSQIADFQVKSEINGKIYSIHKEVGDFISVQEKFAELGSSNNYKLEMEIDEVDITKIEIGDSVIIVLDAYNDELFLARVDKISPKKNDQTQTFRAEGVFDQNIPKLYNGLSGEANIIVAERKNTLVIPTEYLMPNNKVLTDEGEVNVKVGLKNLLFVEILSGINSATSLIKPQE